MNLIPEISPHTESNHLLINKRHKTSFIFHAFDNMICSGFFIFIPPIWPGSLAERDTVINFSPFC